jgi:hypothetical protein
MHYAMSFRGFGRSIAIGLGNPAPRLCMAIFLILTAHLIFRIWVENVERNQTNHQLGAVRGRCYFFLRHAKSHEAGDGHLSAREIRSRREVSAIIRPKEPRLLRDFSCIG